MSSESSERRLHPYSIIFAFLTQIRLFVVPGVLVLVGASSRGGDWWQPWMMLLVIPNAALAVVRFFSYRYRYEASEIVIRSGLLVRRERHIPYARIQNIDAVQNLLHRALNVVEVKVETGGGPTAEATMSVLPTAAFHEMRTRVFAERRAAQGGAAGAMGAAGTLDSGAVSVGDGTVPAQGSTSVEAPAAPPPLLALDTRELILCGFIENRGAVIVAAAFGLVWELGLVDRVIAPMFGQPRMGRGVLRNLLRGALSNVTISWDRIALTMAAFVALLLLVRVLSMGWALVRLHGFRLTLIDGDARSDYGLLTRIAATVPLRRIQSMTIREAPLHRLFARVAVRVATAGGRGDADNNKRNEREGLAPILRRTALGSFVQSIIRTRVEGLEWNSPAAGAFRREVKGWLLTALVIATGLVFWLRWNAVPLIPLLVLWAWLSARQTIRHLGWAVNDDSVLFKSGWLWRRTVIVRFAKIQTVTLHDTPFDRRTGMVRLHIDTAGTSEGGAVDIPYLARDEGVALRDRLALETAQRRFEW